MRPSALNCIDEGLGIRALGLGMRHQEFDSAQNVIPTASQLFQHWSWEQSKFSMSQVSLYCYLHGGQNLWRGVDGVYVMRLTDLDSWTCEPETQTPNTKH